MHPHNAPASGVTGILAAAVPGAGEASPPVSSRGPKDGRCVAAACASASAPETRGQARESRCRSRGDLALGRVAPHRSSQGPPLRPCRQIDTRSARPGAGGTNSGLAAAQRQRAGLFSKVCAVGVQQTLLNLSLKTICCWCVVLATFILSAAARRPSAFLFFGKRTTHALLGAIGRAAHPLPDGGPSPAGLPSGASPCPRLVASKPGLLRNSASGPVRAPARQRLRRGGWTPRATPVRRGRGSSEPSAAPRGPQSRTNRRRTWTDGREARFCLRRARGTASRFGAATSRSARSAHANSHRVARPPDPQ